MENFEKFTDMQISDQELFDLYSDVIETSDSVLISKCISYQNGGSGFTETVCCYDYGAP